MAGIFEQLQPFKEGENWQEYVEHFWTFFMANDIDHGKKKCAFCVQLLGQRLVILSEVCGLPDKPETKTFAAVCDLVKNHLKPKLSEANASLLFYSRSRKKDSGVQMFLAELRRLAGPTILDSLSHEHWVTDLLLD